MQGWHWALVGLALIGLEILTLGGLGNFYFLFFGIAALVVGVLVWLGLTEPVWLQWVLFAVSGIATLLVLQKPLQKKMPARPKQADLVDSMVGSDSIYTDDRGNGRGGTIRIPTGFCTSGMGCWRFPRLPRGSRGLRMPCDEGCRKAVCGKTARTV